MIVRRECIVDPTHVVDGAQRDQVDVFDDELVRLPTNEPHGALRVQADGVQRDRP
ncbi:hypothetical protein D3C71_2047040 [compost metagenome]